MTENGLLENILDRLGASGTAEEMFGADEAAGWPPGALDMLIQSGLLRRAQPTQVIECRGCEEYCFKQVDVLPAEGVSPARALIVCDERDDIGRVPVDFSRLEQWQTTGELIATALAKLLGFSEQPKVVGRNQWHIGTFKGNNLKSSVKLLAGDGLTLSLAGHTVPLEDMLAIEGKALTLDKAELIRLVDNPAGDSEDTDTAEIEGFDFDNDEAEKYATANAKSSVSAMQIRMHFAVISTDEDANHEWWKKMMRNASDNGLNVCRVGGGKKGRGGSLWRPDQIAGWLVDRHERNFEGMNNNSARAALKKFTGYEETADEMFPKGE